MQNQITQVIRSPQSMEARREYIAENRKNADAREGFLCLLDCDDIVGFHVFDDEELYYVLKYKCDNDVHFENMKRDVVLSGPL